MLRQHKIDINLINDVNSTQFLENIGLFVDEMDGKVDYLNLFINSLVDEEKGVELEFMRPTNPEEAITKEHIAFFDNQISVAEKKTEVSKVNRICEALKEELSKRNATNQYLLPILTIYVKKQP
jgi:hypothetical protein